MHLFKTVWISILLVASPSHGAGLISLFETVGKGMYDAIDEVRLRNSLKKELKAFNIVDPKEKPRLDALCKFEDKYAEILKTNNPNTRQTQLARIINQADDTELIDHVDARLPKPDPRFFPEIANTPDAAEIMPLWRKQYHSAAAGLGLATLKTPEDIFWEVVRKKMPEQTQSYNYQKYAFCLPETDQEFKDIFEFAPGDGAVTKMSEYFRSYREIHDKNPKSKKDIHDRIKDLREGDVLVIVGHNPNGVNDPVVTLGKDTQITFDEIEKWSMELKRTVVVISCYSPHVAPSSSIKTTDALDIIKNIQLIHGEMHPQEYLRKVAARSKTTVIQASLKKETRITMMVTSGGAAGLTGGGLLVAKETLQRLEEREQQREENRKNKAEK